MKKLILLLIAFMLLGLSFAKAQFKLTSKEVIEKYKSGHRSFATVNIQNADFKGATLAGTDFASSDIESGHFLNANLKGAIFFKARLLHANFSGANLSGANFSGAILPHANFLGANLSGANFSGAYLSGARITRAQADDLKARKISYIGSPMVIDID